MKNEYIKPILGFTLAIIIMLGTLYGIYSNQQKDNEYCQQLGYDGRQDYMHIYCVSYLHINTRTGEKEECLMPIKLNIPAKEYCAQQTYDLVKKGI